LKRVDFISVMQNCGRWQTHERDEWQFNEQVHLDESAPSTSDATQGTALRGFPPLTNGD
jgi:hypothetical protein